MSNCCTLDQSQPFLGQNICPVNQKKGNKVSLNTLKSLLNPSALVMLNPRENYYFCDSKDCQVVYFSEQNQIYNVNDLKVPVLQKNLGDNVPLCYCFDYTRAKIKKRLTHQGESPLIEIRQHIQANRCGCEFNNPEGKCCLKHITGYINVLEHTS